MENLEIDFDGNWKEIIREFFEDFVAFFLPTLYPDVDFEVPPAFLEQEMLNILENMGDTKRVADKLVKVRLKDGDERWILIHIEVQSYFEKAFSKRMFLMFSMIYAKYGQNIVALVVYTGHRNPRQFNQFEQNNYGTHLIYKFNAYKIAQQNEASLMASENIFALFVLANLNQQPLTICSR